MKLILLVLILTVGLGAGAYYWNEHAKVLAEAAKPKIPTAAVEKGPIRQVVQATGTMSSTLDVDIKCKSSGEIVTLPYDISDAVKKGDLLLAIDPIDEQRAKDQAV